MLQIVGNINQTIAMPFSSKDTMPTTIANSYHAYLPWISLAVFIMSIRLLWSWGITGIADYIPYIPFMLALSLPFCFHIMRNQLYTIESSRSPPETEFSWLCSLPCILYLDCDITSYIAKGHYEIVSQTEKGGSGRSIWNRLCKVCCEYEII